MNNTCRYQRKCQPEYCYPFRYLCGPYSNPHAGNGQCWGLWYPKKNCETTHFWAVRSPQHNNDFRWFAVKGTWPRRGKRQTICQGALAYWFWPGPGWSVADVDHNRLGYPTPGP